MCVDLAGRARHIAVIYAVLRQDERITERPSGDIVRASKAKRTTVQPKTVDAMDGVKKVKKTWMMQLQQG